MIIHELDRLGRSMVEMLVQVNNLLERNIHIKCLDGRLDTSSMPEDLVKLIESKEAKKHPIFYIVDSLDSLSDRAEQARTIDEPTYGAGKAKKMSEILRRLVQDIEQTKIMLLILSQIRDKIGVVFGKT